MSAMGATSTSGTSEPALMPGPWLQRHGLPELWALPFEAMATRALRLQDPLSSLLRGQFGEKLRDLRCLTRASSCHACMEIPHCDYVRLFDAGLHEHTQHTPPYWLQGVPVHEEIAAGSRFAGRLVVLGPTSSLLPYLEASLRDALHFLGRPSRQSSPWSPAFSARLRPPVRLSSPEIHDSARWLVRVHSPLVLRDDPDASAAACPALPELAQVARSGARRLQRLHRAVHGSPPAMSLPDLRDVTVTFGQFVPWSSSRFSQRQEQRMPLNGLLGEVEIAGESLRELSPLLAVLPLLGVGKQTTFGLGHLHTEPMDG